MADMMPRWLAVPVLLAAGALFLWVANRGRINGEVRAGTNFWRVYRPNRQDNPIAFRFFLTLYYCIGIALCVWGLLAMVGMAPSLRW